MPFFIAIFIWLFINYITWWLKFNSLICIFSWILLIMPFLLQFKIKELFCINHIKKYIKKNLILNFVLNILIFSFISILFFWFTKIVLGFILLSILSWGGLLLSWINKTKGDTKLWFQLFIINFIIFNIIFLPFTYIIENYTGEKKEVNTIEQSQPKNYLLSIQNNTEQNNNTCVVSQVSWWKFTCFTPDWWVSPIFSFFVLIIFPFILSRIILFSKSLTNIIKKYIKHISNISTFILIIYIFSIKDVSKIFTFNINTILSIWLTTLLIYLIMYGLNYFLYLKSVKDEKSKTLFWLWTTRFITLWLIFSFVYSHYLWVEILIIFIFAYFYQILLSILFSKILIDKK